MRKTRLALAMAMLPLSSPPLWAAETQLPEVQVKDRQEQTSPLKSSLADTASLLEDTVGVSSYTAGGVSSLPVIHGMADDRLRIKVDGMDLIASCPNHMNSPLSYIDPSNVGSIQVYSGISPVSLGGDSIGGTIIVNSPTPVFAAPGQGTLTQGEVGAFYRSNGNARGAHLNATYATESISLSYAGSTAEADNYKAAQNFKSSTATGRTGHTLALDEVGSTAYKTRNHALTLALKGNDNLIEAKVGYQDIPYELYPNQRMDMLDNNQHSFNLKYQGKFGWGKLEARAYRETVSHYMNFGADKQLIYGTAVNGMPMNTEGETTGALVKADVDLSSKDLLRLGAEYQRYRLKDWWPPSGTGSMSPGNFFNINNGQRNRAALFGEWEARLSPQWTALLGVRYEQVTMNTGDARGYDPTINVSGMMSTYEKRDGDAFNAANHKKTDNNWDLSALTKYMPSEGLDIDFGFARKVRSPNLYERYTWSTWPMAAVMNNTVGDGNGYVGDINLKPEKAHTLSATFDWHAADRNWEFKVTPYFTRVTDYIDAVQWDSANNQRATTKTTSQYSVLKYVNQTARLYGLDISGRAPIASSTAWGDLGFQGMLAYTNGKNLDTNDELYNIMPLNTKLALTQKFENWDNRMELVGVMGKKDVSDARNEIRTGGYSLVHLRGSYSWQKVRLDFGVENLFDRHYQLPLGGAYVGQGMTMSMTGVAWGIAVPGPARSLYTALTVKF
ncbi:TonB-dependent receptor [Denitratisoma sp. agr-D3]